MVNGKKLPVDKPYFLGISDDGQGLVHSALDGGFDTFGPQQVKSIEFIASRRAPAKGKNGRKKGAA
jgi:hypothetical protein